MFVGGVIPASMIKTDGIGIKTDGLGIKTDGLEIKTDGHGKKTDGLGIRIMCMNEGIFE